VHGDQNMIVRSLLCFFGVFGEKNCTDMVWNNNKQSSAQVDKLPINLWQYWLEVYQCWHSRNVDR